MFCNKCGNPMNETDNFCQKCGQPRIVIATAQPVPVAPQPTIANAQPVPTTEGKKQPKSRKKMAILISSIVAHSLLI